MKIICTEQVATLLECNPRNVRYLASDGKLNPVVKHKRFMMFDEQEVLTFKAMRYE